MEMTYKIQDWLSECVRRDGKNNYHWSNDGLVTTLLSSIGSEVNFATILRFKFEEDLVAFKLKFGITK